MKTKNTWNSESQLTKLVLIYRILVISHAHATFISYFCLLCIFPEFLRFTKAKSKKQKLRYRWQSYIPDISHSINSHYFITLKSIKYSQTTTITTIIYQVILLIEYLQKKSSRLYIKLSWTIEILICQRILCCFFRVDHFFLLSHVALIKSNSLADRK